MESVAEVIGLTGFSQEISESALAGGVVGFFIALGVLVAFLLLAGIYIYYSAAWYTIFKKFKHKNPWLAWIPFAKSATILQVGGFHWALVFLYLVPIIGWIAIFVLLMISKWRIFEARHYPGWFTLAILIPQAGLILYLVALGFVAWKDKKRR